MSTQEVLEHLQDDDDDGANDVTSAIIAENETQKILMMQTQEDIPTQPKSFKQALTGEHADAWMEAADAEFEGLEAKGTYELIPETSVPAEATVHASKIVAKVKLKPDGSFDKTKARCVFRGDQTIRGVDFDNTFSPTMRMDTFRILIALCVTMKRDLFGFDVVQAYLNGTLDREMFMRLPQEYVARRPKYAGMVAKLKRTLYGLCQSGRAVALYCRPSRSSQTL